MEPKAKAKKREVPVVYYLLRNKHFEHPHFMEVSIPHGEGLYLRDVIRRLDTLRGKGMASMYSWFSKRSYSNGFVWHDITEDDFIYLSLGNEYILKGSELLYLDSSSQDDEPMDIPKSVRDHSYIRKSRNALSNLDLHEGFFNLSPVSEPPVLDFWLPLLRGQLGFLNVALHFSIAARVKALHESGEREDMLKSMLTCCKLYISESRNVLALESIEKAARLHPEAVIVNRFKDVAYNRVGYTLVADSGSSLDASPLRKSVFSMVKAALEAIDLELHSGTHPRLGVVDHICFHPLAEASLDQAAQIAMSVAADIGRKLQVPTFLYGAAHQGGRTLDSIRRELGYFKPNSSGNQWTGGLQSHYLRLHPDEGPLRYVQSKGVVVIGATSWVDNYNVPVESADIESVKRIARRASARGGGLESVQAMGLAHGDESTEVACNLLDPKRVGADRVQSEVERLAREEGSKAGNGYHTDFSQERIIEMYTDRIQTQWQVTELDTTSSACSRKDPETAS